MADVRLPTNSDRTIVIGRTGSGKTRFGVWLSSVRLTPFRRHFFLDFKGEELFAQMNMTPWAIDAELPTDPGVYWIRILPGQEQEVSQFFLKCYSTSDIFIMIDEAYMLPYQDRWVRACLTQGRSKRIEIVACTQRPVKIDVFFFSEASFISVFALNVRDDRKRVAEYMDGREIPRLPEFHSLWYDVARDDAVTLQPVPSDAILIEAFRDEVEEVAAAPEPEDRIIKL